MQAICRNPSPAAQPRPNAPDDGLPYVLVDALGSSRSRHAVAQARLGGSDLEQPVVLGGALAAGRSAGLEVAAAGADGEVGDEAVVGFPGAVRDELPVPGPAAERHGL